MKSTSDLIDAGKLKTIARNRGLGCDHCLAGLRSPAPLGIFRTPNIALDVCDWCDCETGQKLRAKIASWGEYDQAAASEEQAAKAKSIKLEQLFGNAGVPRQFQSYTFKGWIDRAGSDPGKATLRSAVLEHSQQMMVLSEKAPDGMWPGIFAYGPSDLGKTGGLVPLFKKHLEDGNVGLWIRYRDMMNGLKDFDHGGEDVRERLRRLKEVPMLFLDELGDPGAAPSNYERDIIFDIISDRRAQYLPTFITSNLQPDELREHFGERVVKRIFELCADCPVGGPPMGALKGIQF